MTRRTLQVSRCPACPGTNKCVPPIGPNDARVLLCGEAPGVLEDKRLEPFVGKTGEELNRHYLPLAGLRRESVYITNAISCLPPSVGGRLDSKRQKDLDMLASCCEHHLYPELERVRPELIVPMGVFACRAIDPDIDLELQHGIPLQTKWGMTFPMFHPAGGVHEPKKMLHIRTDWSRLRKYLTGKLALPVDEYAGYEDYRLIETEKELDAYLDGCNDYAMAGDTETKRGGDPFCLSLSIMPGTARVIGAWAKKVLARLQWWLDRWRGKFLWHNWLFDSEVVEAMGLQYNRRLIIDTMVRAFHLGNVPQGLKALAYRELGMKMQDFDDLVSPFSSKRVIDYYRNAICEDWPVPEEQMVRTDSGGWKTYKAQGMNTKLKTFFTYLAKNPNKDVFEAWDNWEDSHALMEERLGRWPGKCISHAWEDDQDAVVFYSCRDSDSLLRLEPILTRMRTQVRRRPQELWRDFAVA